MDIPAAVGKMLDWAVAVDVEAAKAAVAQLRSEFPDAGPEELARYACDGGRWRAAGSGLATGLLANPLLAAGAAVADAALTLRMQVETAAQVALVFDPGHFDRPGAAEELLVPILGAKAADQLLAASGEAPVVAEAVTRQMVRKVLTGGRPTLLYDILLRTLATTLPARGLFGKTIPILGGLVSGWWNWRDTGLVGERLVAYFSGKPLPAERE